MIKQFTINGEKYSLHIKDATEQNGKAIVRYSDRDTDAPYLGFLFCCH